MRAIRRVMLSSRLSQRIEPHLRSLATRISVGHKLVQMVDEHVCISLKLRSSIALMQGVSVSNGLLLLREKFCRVVL